VFDADMREITCIGFWFCYHLVGRRNRKWRHVMSTAWRPPESSDGEQPPPSEDALSLVRTDSSARARLEQLGFTPPSIVRDALQHGAGTAKSVTPWHPAAYGGYRMWAETIFALSWLGNDAGWEKEPVNGVELVTNHLTSVAVIVTAGNAATGFENYRPECRYDRPEMVQAIVNGTLDRLWDPERRRSDWQVWFLLHKLAAPSDVVRAELSLPASIGPDGQVTRWVERLIIPGTSTGGGVERSAEEPDTTPEPVVTVRRRAS
jgi:hypothetical protein